MIIVIVGATATGKSALSIQLAKRYNAEIISGDSVQIYKELTIGSAKISQIEMEDIPHYFIDQLHYDEPYNVKIFQELARKLIADISSRGKNVIICGGTGLYIKALLYDYVFYDEKDSDIYKKQFDTYTNEQLYEQLLYLDAEACKDIHLNNRQRLIRALVMAKTGEKKSDRIKNQQHIMLYDALLIGLNASRTLLYQRINDRVEQMFEQGLVQEVEQLLAENVWELQSMKAIGYKEFKPYFEGIQSLEEVKEKIKTNTRHLAKRQYTYFNNQFNIRYFSIEDENYVDQIISYIEENYNE